MRNVFHTTEELFICYPGLLYNDDKKLVIQHNVTHAINQTSIVTPEASINQFSFNHQVEVITDHSNEDVHAISALKIESENLNIGEKSCIVYSQKHEEHFETLYPPSVTPEISSSSNCNQDGADDYCLITEKNKSAADNTLITNFISPQPSVELNSSNTGSSNAYSNENGNSSEMISKLKRVRFSKSNMEFTFDSMDCPSGYFTVSQVDYKKSEVHAAMDPVVTLVDSVEPMSPPHKKLFRINSFTNFMPRKVRSVYSRVNSIESIERCSLTEEFYDSTSTEEDDITDLPIPPVANHSLQIIATSEKVKENSIHTDKVGLPVDSLNSFNSYENNFDDTEDVVWMFDADEVIPYNSDSFGIMKYCQEQEAEYRKSLERCLVDCDIFDEMN